MPPSPSSSSSLVSSLVSNLVSIQSSLSLSFPITDYLIHKNCQSSSSCILDYQYRFIDTIHEDIDQTHSSQTHRRLIIRQKPSHYGLPLIYHDANHQDCIPVWVQHTKQHTAPIIITTSDYTNQVGMMLEVPSSSYNHSLAIRYYYQRLVPTLIVNLYQYWNREGVQTTTGR